MENFVLIGVCVIMGMVFRRLQAFPKDTAQAFNMFALYLSLPALVLLKAPQITISRDMLAAALIPWAMLIFSAALVVVGGWLWKWPRETVGVLLLVVPLGNTSFMGVPVVQAFFGSAGLPYLIIYDQFGTMLIFATYGSLILALYGRDRTFSAASVAKKMILFPPTIALVLGLALRGWSYPKTMALVLQAIAASLVPLVMTAIGFQLRLRLPRRVTGPMSYGLAIKLLAAPLSVLLVCRLTGLCGGAIDVSVIEAGTPPMVTAGALAVVSGMEADLAVALVGVGIVLSFGTLPMLYWLLR